MRYTLCYLTILSFLPLYDDFRLAMQRGKILVENNIPPACAQDQINGNEYVFQKAMVRWLYGEAIKNPRYLHEYRVR